MSTQTQSDDMREKMQMIKTAYGSRHYTQCAKHGERMLADVKGDIHPIHLAYLNFYTALSHDTLAREATIKNRYKELKQAEKHYMAAIAALTPLKTETEEPSSPTTPTSPISEAFVFQGRRVSFAESIESNTSAASSATSFSPDADMEYSLKGLGSYSFPQPPRSTSPLTKPTLSTTITTTPLRSQSPSELHLAAESASFTAMLRTHLQNVQDLKGQTSVPSVRFSNSAPKAEPVSARARCTQWLEGDGAERETVRRERTGRVWRKRFDPGETQRLCAEALAELR